MENRQDKSVKLGRFDLATQDNFAPRIGAEAKIDLINWHGKKAIRKLRIRKSYRNPELDRQLRLRRTKEEVDLLHEAKLAGVDTPEVLFADPDSCEIVLEYVDGQLLKDFGADKTKLYKLLGKYSAQLHSKGIIHGDLTTKNLIVSRDRLVLIDFGLSFISDRIEDRAEDLHLLKQALRSQSSSLGAKNAFAKVLQGYRSIAGEVRMKKLLRQIEQIELRGRYARVD